jgi:hypothetical protein
MVDPAAFEIRLNQLAPFALLLLGCAGKAVTGQINDIKTPVVNTKKIYQARFPWRL